MRWRISYVDGSTFSNEDGAPEDAPGFGVAAIVQKSAEVGVTTHHQRDFYCFAAQFDGWYGLDVFGLTQYLGKPGHKIVKLGEVMPLEQYRALITEVRANPNLPTKSARYEWEAPA